MGVWPAGTAESDSHDCCNDSIADVGRNFLGVEYVRQSEAVLATLISCQTMCDFFVDGVGKATKFQTKGGSQPRRGHFC